MATTTTTHTKGAAQSLPQKAAIGLLSSIPTKNPTLRALQKTLPLLPPSILPNLGNSQSSAMAATLAAGPSPQNPTTATTTTTSNATNTNQNNMCEVWEAVDAL